MRRLGQWLRRTRPPAWLVVLVWVGGSVLSWGKAFGVVQLGDDWATPFLVVASYLLVHHAGVGAYDKAVWLSAHFAADLATVGRRYIVRAWLRGAGLAMLRWGCALAAGLAVFRAVDFSEDPVNAVGLGLCAFWLVWAVVDVASRGKLCFVVFRPFAVPKRRRFAFSGKRLSRIMHPYGKLVTLSDPIVPGTSHIPRQGLFTWGFLGWMVVLGLPLYGYRMFVREPERWVAPLWLAVSLALGIATYRRGAGELRVGAPSAADVAPAVERARRLLAPGWRRLVSQSPIAVVATEATWRSCVAALLPLADLVIIDGSAPTEAIAWEVEQVRALVKPERVVVMVSETATDANRAMFDGFTLLGYEGASSLVGLRLRARLERVCG